MSIDLYAEHAREKAQLPTNWQIFRWECFPKDATAAIYINLTGAVCEHKYSKGKRKGRTNWSKRDLSTEATVSLFVSEHEAWTKEWEQRTGMCSRCTGTGKVFYSWSTTTGTEDQPCPKCQNGRVDA